MTKTLGIFHGKKATYNKLILRSLATGGKATMQIAKYIQQNSQIRGLNKKTINSIICRKGSRLEELSKKEYIKRENNLWHLTSKGNAVALTLFDNLSDMFEYIKMDPMQTLDWDPALGKMNAFFEKVFDFPLFNLELKDEKDLVDFMKNPQFLQLYLQQNKDITNEMIKKGVDLDSMTEEEFKALLGVRLAQWLFKMFFKGSLL